MKTFKVPVMAIFFFFLWITSSSIIRITLLPSFFIQQFPIDRPEASSHNVTLLRVENTLFLFNIMCERKTNVLQALYTF